MTVSLAMACAFEAARAEELCEVARRGEEAGLAMVMMGDSPAQLGDLYVALTLIAQHTTRARVGSFVTNPVTRHPVVTCAAISTIQALSGGRAFLGISTGHGGVLNTGARPGNQAQLEEYVATLRALWRDGEAQYQGATVRFQWSRDPVPIYLAPGGPRGLHLAGRIADGVIIEAGFHQEVVDDALARLAAGAAEVGRTLDDIDVWWHARAAIGDSVDDAVHQIRASLAAIANRAARFSQLHKLIPAHLLPGFRELARRFAMIQPEVGRSSHNAELLEELGLLDYAVERWGLVGTPSDWVDRLHDLEGRGVRQIAMAGVTADKVGFVETLGAEVIPKR